MTANFSVWLTTALAQAADSGKMFPDQQPVQGDFRRWVWIAYGLVLLLLAGYSLFVSARNRAATERLAHLEERFEHSGGAAAASSAPPAS